MWFLAVAFGSFIAGYTTCLIPFYIITKRFKETVRTLTGRSV